MMSISKSIQSIFTSKFHLLFFSIGTLCFLYNYLMISNGILDLVCLISSSLVVITCIEYTYIKTKKTTVLGLIGFLFFSITAIISSSILGYKHKYRVRSYNKLEEGYFLHPSSSL